MKEIDYSQRYIMPPLKNVKQEMDKLTEAQLQSVQDLHDRLHQAITSQFHIQLIEDPAERSAVRRYGEESLPNAYTFDFIAGKNADRRIMVKFVTGYDGMLKFVFWKYRNQPHANSQWEKFNWLGLMDKPYSVLRLRQNEWMDVLDLFDYGHDIFSLLAEFE